MQNVFRTLKWCHGEKEVDVLCFSRAAFVHPGSVLESAEELFANFDTWVQS